MTLLAVLSLDQLAQYFGYANYDAFKGLVYPQPMYHSFTLPKKSGGMRLIETPGLKLKQLQRKLANDLTDIFARRSPVAHSFIRGRSAVSNALAHVSRESVIRVDLENFFHQIHFGRVKGVFMSPPFSFPADVAAVLAHVCCYQKRLPQGAPTSPPITNFVCLPLDRQLAYLAKRYKGRYTRYSDDLTFSFSALPLQKIPPELFIVEQVAPGHLRTEAGPLVTEVISKQGFKINANKTRGANRKTHRQMVTGVVVNHGLSLPSTYIDQIRRALFLWQRLGLADAEKRGVPVLHSKKYASGAAPSLMQLLRGKLSWLAKVTGLAGSNYQRLASQYNTLVVAAGRSDLMVRIVPVVRNYEDAVKATWYLKAETHTGTYDVLEGTAFRLSGNAWITCAHCIGDLKSRKAFEDLTVCSGSWGTSEIKVRVVDVDWDRDLATLRPLPLVPLPRYLPFFEVSKSSAAAGQELGVLGFPSSHPYQPPVFLRTQVVRTRSVKGVNRVEVDKQFVGGNSGGPAVDQHYRVVGVVVEGASVATGMNSCIDAHELKHLRKA